MKKILLILPLLLISLYSKNLSSTINSEIYLLPSQANIAKDEILDLIKNSNDEIIIAIYNFSYKKIQKELIKAAKRGVKVTVILDEEKNSKNNKFSKTLKNNSIIVKIPKEKMHLKLALFDQKYAILGSANWTKESFSENIEFILKTDEKKIIFKIRNELLKL